MTTEENKGRSKMGKVKSLKWQTEEGWKEIQNKTNEQFKMTTTMTMNLKYQARMEGDPKHK